VLFLQHPRERGKAIGTARIAHLSLPGSTLVEGVALEEHPAVVPVLGRDDVALLYPGPDARSAAEWKARPPSVLVVIDGTWSQAKKLLEANPKIASLPRMSLEPETPGNYRIRKEPTAQHLATVEAVAMTLGILEGDTARFAQMLKPFDFMVDRQLEYEQHRNPRTHKRPKRVHTSLPELVPLLEAPERAVIVYAEANNHSRNDRAPGAPELIQLVAVRPATGAHFEAILKPRRPLGSRVPARLGIERELLLDGEEVSAFSSRWRAFLGDDAELCAWGHFSRDLLQRETPTTRGFVDLRGLTARCLGGSAGGIERGAQRLCEGSPAEDSRRADRMLSALEQIFRALMERARRAHEVDSPRRLHAT